MTLLRCGWRNVCTSTHDFAKVSKRNNKEKNNLDDRNTSRGVRGGGCPEDLFGYVCKASRMERVGCYLNRTKSPPERHPRLTCMMRGPCATPDSQAESSINDDMGLGQLKEDLASLKIGTERDWRPMVVSAGNLNLLPKPRCASISQVCPGP